MSLEIIFNNVWDRFGISRAQIMAPTRSTGNIAWARQVAMYLAWTILKEPDDSFSHLGRVFGRDRTTVRHACRKVARLRGVDYKFDDWIKGVQRECSVTPI